MLIYFLNNFDIKIIATSFDIRVKSPEKRKFFWYNFKLSTLDIMISKSTRFQLLFFTSNSYVLVI